MVNYNKSTKNFSFGRLSEKNIREKIKEKWHKYKDVFKKNKDEIKNKFMKVAFGSLLFLSVATGVKCNDDQPPEEETYDVLRKKDSGRHDVKTDEDAGDILEDADDNDAIVLSDGGTDVKELNGIPCPKEDEDLLGEKFTTTYFYFDKNLGKLSCDVPVVDNVDLIIINFEPGIKIEAANKRGIDINLPTRDIVDYVFQLQEASNKLMFIQIASQRGCVNESGVEVKIDENKYSYSAISGERDNYVVFWSSFAGPGLSLKDGQYACTDLPVPGTGCGKQLRTIPENDSCRILVVNTGKMIAFFEKGKRITTLSNQPLVLNNSPWIVEEINKDGVYIYRLMLKRDSW